MHDELRPTLFDMEPAPAADPTRRPTTAEIDDESELVDDHEPPFIVEVRRSAKRKRTVGAELRGGVLRIAVPSWMSAAEEEHWVAKMTASFLRKHSSDRIDLT